MIRITIVCFAVSMTLAAKVDVASKSEGHELEAERVLSEVRKVEKSVRLPVGYVLWPNHESCDADYDENVPFKRVRVPQKRKTVEFYTCRFKWDFAQRNCIANGGKLWEPADQSEYDFVMNKIGFNVVSRTPKFMFDYFHFWIGFKNTEGYDATYWSNSNKVAWKQLTEAQNPNQDCVDIYYPGVWGDHQCSMELPFICEVPSCPRKPNVVSVKDKPVSVANKVEAVRVADAAKVAVE